MTLESTPSSEDQVDIEAAKTIMRRIDAVWPPRHPAPADEYQEWKTFLLTLDGDIASRAIDEMRRDQIYRPKMADLQSAYHICAAIAGDKERFSLPAGDSQDSAPTLEDRYGANQNDWVYCWRCNMAISLDDLEERSRFDNAKGLRHPTCPRNGSSPTMPVHLKLQREEQWRSHRIGGPA